MNCIASMRSMTYATKAKRLLWSAGINCEISSLSQELTRRGCAYGVKFDCRFTESVRTILNENGFRSSEILTI
jgi:hypothetical protein